MLPSLAALGPPTGPKAEKDGGRSRANQHPYRTYKMAFEETLAALLRTDDVRSALQTAYNHALDVYDALVASEDEADYTPMLGIWGVGYDETSLDERPEAPHAILALVEFLHYNQEVWYEAKLRRPDSAALLAIEPVVVAIKGAIARHPNNWYDELRNGVPLPVVIPKALQQPQRVPEQLSVDVVGPETKIVKVKQPWADALVTGKKDVENRTWPITSDCGPDSPTWFLVASSKPKPTKMLMQDYERRLELQYPHGRPHVDVQSDFAYGAIIGLVRLKGCYPSWPSVWYNPPDLAWVVDEAWEFEEPIQMHLQDGMQTQGSLGSGDRARFGYVESVRAQIAKLLQAAGP